jgi:hypothetical protein
MVGGGNLRTLINSVFQEFPIYVNRVRTSVCFFAKFFGAPMSGLVVVSVLVMFLANEDPFVRDALCQIGHCFYSDAALGWNKLFYDFSAGCVITVVFYWLLVRLPEHQKRQRIKKSFKAQYRAFKLACIENFLAVADGGFDSKLPETLLPIEKFRSYFKQDVGSGKTRWDEVVNKMTPYYLDATISRMENLRQEISFVMHNSDISESEVFELLKGLSQAMLLQRNATTDYDSINSFLGFFWKLFAGWDWVDGYRSRDIVEEMVESI